MIRELAENPNVHQLLSEGRELVTDPRGRFAIYLTPGRAPDCATVQRVRLASTGVAPAVEEIRALLRARGREGAEWEIGESCTPADLVHRLLDLGLRPDESDPVAIGMVLEGRPLRITPPGVDARRVRSVDELIVARKVQRDAFGDPRAVDEKQATLDFEREGIDGSTFVALIDGVPVAAGYAAYTTTGLILFGGATREDARGRGAYRALVAARAREGETRGTPTLVVHAGRRSRPILERLGFRAVARIDRLLDVLV